MSIAIYTQNDKQSQKWLEKLSDSLVGEKVEVYPNISNFTDVEFLVCWKPETGLLDRFPNLRAIQSLGAGVDHILDHHTISTDIQVSKVVDDNLTHDMWEHALSIIMADMKHLSYHAKNQSDITWKPKRYKRIKDVSVGILGLGTIGRYVASQMSNIGFAVSGWSKSKKDIANVTTYVGESGLMSMLATADFVINILPLTPDTESMIDATFLGKMKQGAFLINIGRGSHVVEKDLLDSIDSGHLRGAALDVFRVEPLPGDNPLWSHASVSVTPHIASLTHIDSVYPQVAENYRRLKEGKPLLHRIDLEKGY